MKNIDDKVSLDEKKYKRDPLKTITNEELAIVLYKHKCWIESEGKEGEKAELIRFNLSGKNLSNANLENAKLHGTSFHKANLSNANLKNAGLKGAFFNEANLINADLSGAVLKFAELKKTHCTWTSFKKADLFRTNFEGAEIDWVNFIDAKTGDKSLEKLLETAKVTSISLSNLTREEEIVIVDEDEDELFNDLKTSTYGKEGNVNKEDVNEEHFDEEDLELEDKSQKLKDKERLPSSLKPPITSFKSLIPSGKFNLRLIGVIALALALLIAVIFSNNIGRSKVTAKELNNSELALSMPTLKAENDIAVASDQEEDVEATDETISYNLELDENKVEENPIIVLAVGNVTTLDLEEQPKEIVIGDKEVLEITKSKTNSKRLYLTGKAPIGASNIVIQTKSKSITIFFQVVEDGSIGNFNGQVVVKS